MVATIDTRVIKGCWGVFKEPVHIRAMFNGTTIHEVSRKIKAIAPSVYHPRAVFSMV